MQFFKHINTSDLLDNCIKLNFNKNHLKSMRKNKITQTKLKNCF